MKSKNLIILALFLFLYIGLVNPSASFTSPTMATEKNMDKKFVASEEVHNETIELASAGDAGDSGVSGTYTNTHIVDASYYGAFATGNDDAWVLLNFSHVPSNISGFRVAFYCIGYDDDAATYGGDMDIWDFTAETWVDVGDLNTTIGYQWNNATFYNSDYWNSVVMIRVYRDSVGTGDTQIVVDYAEVTYYYLTIMPHWNEIISMEILFNVSVYWKGFNIIIRFFPITDYILSWGFHTFFIILGLIILPASGLYLVHGGRKNASIDKLFLALVAFFIGWALLIGGIMP